MPNLFPIDRYLNVRAAAAPSFSPDGRFIAYLSNTTGIPQAWMIPVEGGEPVQLTFGDDVVREVHFSPVRHELIFSMDAGGNERTQLFRLFGIGRDDLSNGWDFENLTRQPNAIHTFGGWNSDGTRIAFSANRDDPSRFDIFTMDLASGRREPKLLAKGPGGYYTALSWSPDDRLLLIVRIDSNVNQDLYSVETATGHIRHLTPHAGDVQFISPVWSGDGTTIQCGTTYEGRDIPALAEIDAASGKIRILREYHHEIELIETSDHDRWLAIDSNVEGRSELTIVHRDGREVKAKLPLGVISDVDISGDSSRIVISLDGPRHNCDIWIGDPESGSFAQLTHSGRAGLPFPEFIEPELIRYKSFDGREIPAWFFSPPAPANSGREAGAGPPIIVYPHGGPESQTRPNFVALFQYFLARGYAILAPNVRGSSGYGIEFMNADNIEKRMDSVADLAQAAYWLRDQNKGDPKRIAVYGGSYGGFMVLAALTHYPDLWAAGIDVVGVANFVTFLENTGEWRRAHREKEYGNLRDHRQFLERISPINHVDKIRCPLMVIHGANDPRVPVIEAEQIVAALKKRRVPVEYLRYEDEGHGLVKLKNRLDAYPKMADFLDRYVKG